MFTLITGNCGKAKEFKSVLPDIQTLELDLPEIQHTDPQKVIEHKLQSALAFGSRNLMVEDTSLCFNGMGHLPGPLIKWFIQELGLAELATLAHSIGTGSALATTCIGIYRVDKQEYQYFSGSTRGRISPPKGENGFGWDKIFIPDGSNRTFAEMTDSDKWHYSMRRKSLEACLKVI